MFQRLGSSDPVDLDYGWNGNTWICDELGLRFDLPAGGVIYDSEEQQKAREEKFGRRGSAGQVLLTVIDPGEGSNLELLVVRTDLPTEDFLLKMATLYAENAAGEGSFELEAREDLTVGGRPWRTWRIELPEQGRVNWYLYRQDGKYALSLTSSGPTVQTPPAILACFQGTNSLTGNTFLCGDGSQLCLQEGGDFRWYQSAEDHEKPYYEGVYEVRRGQAAMDMVASMTEYGLTMEELERVLAASMNGYIPGESRPIDYLYAMGELEDDRERYQVCLDTFYAVILHNQRLVTSPEEVREGGNSTLYIGFYLPELGMADLTNCNAGSNTQWTFQEKTA